MKYKKIAAIALNMIRGKNTKSGSNESIRYILTIAGSFLVFLVIIVSLIVSIPVIVMQKALSGVDTVHAEMISFAETQIQRSAEYSNNILSDLWRFITGDDTYALYKDIDYEDILIIYALKYKEFDKVQSRSKSRVDAIARSFIRIEVDEEGNETKSLKSFFEVIEESSLDEQSKKIAINMHCIRMYNQLQSGVYAEYGSKNFGTVIFKESNIDVVYFNQTDTRWATLPYGDGTIGRAGCGPACLAICAASFGLNVGPVDVANWAADNGYKASGFGSYHSLIPDGAAHYGLNCESIESAQGIVDALSEGKLVIALMGQGTFTSSGHFIVLRGVTQSGKILVADPFTYAFCNREWDLKTVIYKEAKHGASAGGPFWALWI